jgi:hypothetical protein
MQQACRPSGYVIDNIKPLKHGGADAPSNMQWRTKAAGQALSFDEILLLCSGVIHARLTHRTTKGRL